MRLHHGRRRPGLAVIPLAALLLAACGRSSGNPSSGGGSPSPSGTALSVQTDSASGQASGQGIQGVWFAVSAPGSSTSAAGSGGSSGGGGGGYGGYGS